MAEAASERELKVDVPFHFALPDLSPAGVRLDPRPAVHLAATYWDTADLDLLRRGITLRYRKGESRGTEEEHGWTLKLPDRPGGGSGPRLDRTELTWTAPANGVPPEAKALLLGVSLGRPLEPVADMVTSRRRWHLLYDARPVAELDDDDVVVTSGGERHAFRQIEIELTGDDERVLDAIAEELRQAGAPPGDAVPKLERALAARLAASSGRRDPELAPAEAAHNGIAARQNGPAEVPTATPPSFPNGPETEPSRATARAPGRLSGPRSTLADAVAAAVRAGLDRLIAHDPGVRLRQDPEFVHQARVATRRLRSDLRTLGGDLDPEWVSETRDELRWLGGLFGEVRDADVLGERLEGRRAFLSDGEPLDELLARLGSQRAAAYDLLDEAMAGKRYLALLKRLAFPPAAAIDEPAADALGPRIGRAWRKLRRQVRAAGPQPSDADLHQIRIRAKQLRYAAEASAPVLGRPVAGLARKAADLQTILGDHHDAVVAEAWLRSTTVRVRTKSRLLVAGQLIGFERHDASVAVGAWTGAWKAVRAAHRKL